LAFGQNRAAQAGQADSFDKPLKTQVVDFGPSPYYPEGKVRVKLFCYSYPAFMVKEYDEGQEGAAWQSIVPAGKGVVPACTKDAAVGEWRINLGNWNGYFKGAKGNLVFLDDPDGTDEGLQFFVFDSTSGKKIFEDSAHESRTFNDKDKTPPFDRMRFSRAQDGMLRLRYLRVVQLDCDLHLEKTSCWERARKTLELKGAQIPVCSRYEGISDRWVSAIAYPVEVLLLPQPSRKTIDGPIRCWPVD
jgi:hypothetical protein